MPTLRHDWLCIPDRNDFLIFTLSTLAWSPDGVGAPRPYPTDYLLAIANAAVAFAAGAKIEYVAFVTGVALVCVCGAHALANTACKNVWNRFGLACFALYNPWVYTKVVSGHLAMICAYGATMGLLAQCLSPKPRWTLAALFVCLVSVQLQFLLIAMLLLTYIAVVRRHPLPLVTGVVIALPTIVGVATNAGFIAGTPYALSWQTLQSVRPIEAAALTGYFAGYTRGFPPVAFDAVWAMLALAVVGAVTSNRLGRTITLAAFGIGALAWASALSGPLATVYSAAILRFPALEVFRELYDLVGYVAIAYIGLAASAGRLLPLLTRATVLPGLVLLATWFLVPPGRWWVAEEELPRVSPDAPAYTRFAMLPDSQPMTFRGRGSGLDPNAYARPAGVTPLNGSSSAYPAAVALKNFELSGSTSQLAALGVSRIILRSWLTTDNRTLAHQFALPASPPRLLNGRTISLQARSELALVSPLNVVALPPPLGSEAVFFGDVAGMRGAGIPQAWADYPKPSAIKPSGREIMAARDWVDVRQAFVAQPELGQGIGGVITTSTFAALDIRAPINALVWVRGTLLDSDRRPLLRSTGGYRWSAIPAKVTGLRCLGECVVAALGIPPSLAASNADPQVTRVRFGAIVPWFAAADLPADASVGFLRYEIGYDTHWIALSSHGALPHFRVETAFNGWLVPAHALPLHVVIIEAVAAVQLLLECIGLAWTLTLVVRVVREQVHLPLESIR